MIIDQTKIFLPYLFASLASFFSCCVTFGADVEGHVLAEMLNAFRYITIRNEMIKKRRPHFKTGKYISGVHIIDENRW